MSGAIRGVAELCEEVDAMPEDAAGELVLADETGRPRGIVFVEHRRVCWAAARGLARRLSDLLASRANLGPSTLEACYRTCERERVPLGEYLVDHGILEAAALRAALLQHTTESLRAVTSDRAFATLRPRVRGYEARFTFATAEVLAACTLDPRGEEEANVYFRDNGWGAAFLRGEGATPHVVGLAGEPPSDATTVVRLGRWATSVIDVSGALQGIEPMFSSCGRDGTFVAFESAGFLLAGKLPLQGAARILNRRANALAARRAREA